MTENNSKGINFQHYIDLVKQNELNWNTFIVVLQELSYSDMDRLRYLNAILLNELTMNYSDMDKSKYLNVMLLNEFKNMYIQRKDNLKMTAQNEDIEESKESNDDQLLNKETTEQVSTIQTPIENDFKDNLVSCKEETNEFNSSENNVKIFLCDICNKEYSIYFHLKQHIRKVHEATRSFHLNSIQNDRILEEHEIANNENDKSILNIFIIWKKMLL